MSKIAVLVDRLFEDYEFRVLYDRLRAAGHEVDVVGREEGSEVSGLKNKEHVKIEKSVRKVTERDYDALAIVGGYAPDHLRTSMDAVRFTRSMGVANKPVAAVCHGPSMLIEADLVEDRTVTSWPSVRTDLVNAGARWVDRDVVIDGNIITSRNPQDMEAFSAAILDEVARGAAERPEQMPAPEAAPEQPPVH